MNFFKKINFVFLLVILSFTASSQDYFLKTNVLGPIINQPFSVGFEVNKSKQHSFVFNIEGGWYMRDWVRDFNQPYWKKRITGIGFIPEYRYYFRYRSNLNRPVGFFAGSYLVIRYLNYEQDFRDPVTDDIYEENYAGGGGALVGYKFKQPDSKFFVEALLGVGLGYIEIVDYESDYLPDQYLLSRVEISVGYAFQ